MSMEIPFPMKQAGQVWAAAVPTSQEDQLCPELMEGEGQGEGLKGTPQAGEHQGAADWGPEELKLANGLQYF